MQTFRIEPASSIESDKTSTPAEVSVKSIARIWARAAVPIAALDKVARLDWIVHVVFQALTAAADSVEVAADSVEAEVVLEVVVVEVAAEGVARTQDGG